MYKRRRIETPPDEHTNRNLDSSQNSPTLDLGQATDHPPGALESSNRFRHRRRQEGIDHGNIRESTVEETVCTSPTPYSDISGFQQQQQQPYFTQQTLPPVGRPTWPSPPAPTTPYSASLRNVSLLESQTVIASSHSPNPHTGVSHITRDGSLQLGTTPLTGYAGDDTPSMRDTAMSDVSTDTAAAADSVYPLEDASMHLKIQSLPILENLAVQVIQTVSKFSHHSIQQLIQGIDTEEGRAYSTLKGLFEQTRRLYGRDGPFIDAIAVQLFQPSQQETIRRANIATFVSSVLGAHDVSFFQLNEFFLETFVSLGHRLLKWQGEMFLELKTQAYISALMNSDGDRESILEELFPTDLDAQILSRHPDTASLSPSELDFVERTKARKNYLFAEPMSDASIRDLPKKYQWVDFVREFAVCVGKNVDGILNLPLKLQMANGINAGSNASDKTSEGTHTNHEKNHAALLDNPGTGSFGLFLNSISAPLPDRLESGKKSSSTNATIRQPWTKAEEDALIAGLEKVGGPHWSQILALYGRGGSVSEVLKDRNQVQLKDKARNLKLWHLKMGKEVPIALKGVTGELRKRGGVRARAALSSREE